MKIEVENVIKNLKDLISGDCTGNQYDFREKIETAIIFLGKSDKYGNFRSYTGSISIASIEEYAQYMANTYGWTTPDARIFYKDGHIKEIMVNG